ncbi:MAG: hypothetical protein R3D97_01285 [Paracoccaceae bacterium]
MDLEDFVEKTLLSITEGVTKAQQKSRLFIAPGFVENQKVVEPQMVGFEVSVTTGKEAGGGIKVLTFGDAKAIGKSENRNTITFQVPVYFQAPTPLNERHFSRKEKKEKQTGKAAGGSGGGGGWDPDGKHIIAESPKD